LISIKDAAEPEVRGVSRLSYKVDTEALALGTNDTAGSEDNHAHRNNRSEVLIEKGSAHEQQLSELS